MDSGGRMKQGQSRAAMTAKRLAPLCAWWLLLATANSFGQRYPILPVPGSPRSIYTMMQDSRSRIWMGTIDDLFCFDGVHFFSLRGYGYPRETAWNHPRPLGSFRDSDTWGGIR